MPLLSRRRQQQPAQPQPLRIAAPPGVRLALHVGCGMIEERGLDERFLGPEWCELRLDIDPGVEPDIVANITDMRQVLDASVDAVFSSHNIEHVYAHEVPRVLGEFFRVLRPGGEVLLLTPDLQNVARAIASGRLEDPLYRSPAGGITALDVVYGFGSQIAEGREFMAHRTGYTRGTLMRRLGAVGFTDVQVTREAPFALRARARRPAA